MEKRTKTKKYIKKAILIILLSIIAIITIQQPVKADFDVNSVQIQVGDQNELVNRFGGVITTLTNIGSIAAEVLLIVVGIKFMTGSVEEKADYKQKAVPYVIGAMFVFATSSIINIIITLGNQLSGSTSVEGMGQVVLSMVSTIGSLISVIVLAILGIKYMMGSLQEKAEYKKSFIPYVVGAILVFAVTRVIDMIKETGLSVLSDSNIEGIGQKIFTVITVIGSLLSVIVLVILGIKYMMGSVAEKAEYKKTFMPYVVGAGVVFAASQIAGMIYQFAINL